MQGVARRTFARDDQQRIALQLAHVREHAQQEGQVLLEGNAAHVQQNRLARPDALLLAETLAVAGYKAVLGHAGGNHVDGTRHAVNQQPLPDLVRRRHDGIHCIELAGHHRARQP